MKTLHVALKRKRLGVKKKNKTATQLRGDGKTRRGLSLTVCLLRSIIGLRSGLKTATLAKNTHSGASVLQRGHQPTR